LPAKPAEEMISNNWKIFCAFVVKEARHIVRDRRTMLILFGMPVVMMLLFGFAITTDVRNVQMVVVSSSMDNSTRKIVDRLNASEYFDVTRFVDTPAEAEQLMRQQQAEIAVCFAPNFAERQYKGGARVQIILDCADPNMAVQRANYASAIIAHAVSIKPVGGSPQIFTKLLYNPQMRSAYNFVPGIMGMLLMLICAMMTSISIAREKERGNMEVLLVSPVRPLVIILTKAVPYMVLSLVILVAILLISYFLLDVPLSGSIIAIFTVSLIYILVSLSLGLLISSVAQTQMVAMLFSGAVLIMPCLLLSGMIYPVESMPDVLHWIANVIPARWYVQAMRKLMIMGTGIGMVAQETLILVMMAVVLVGLTLKTFKERL